MRKNKQARPAISRPAASFLGAAALAVWLLMLWAALRSEPLGWERTGYEWVRSWDVPGLTGFLSGITWISNTPVALAYSAALIVALAALRRLRLATLFLAAGILDLLNSTVLQDLIGRPRPDPLVRAASDSFPSGHAFHSVLFFGLVVAVLLLPRLRGRWSRAGLIVLWLAFVLATGLSRVHLGFHQPLDILGGYLLAGLALGAVLFANSRMPAPESKQSQPS
jgi:undecaprenyl-diphosphatase